MTEYPNREHRVADEAARRRALASLEAITASAGIVRQKLERDGTWVDGSDARVLAVAVGQLTENLTILETLRDVREWHEADKADAEHLHAADTEPDAECPHCHSRDRNVPEFVKVPETRGRMRCINPWHEDGSDDGQDHYHGMGVGNHPGWKGHAKVGEGGMWPVHRHLADGIRWAEPKAAAGPPSTGQHMRVPDRPGYMR